MTWGSGWILRKAAPPVPPATELPPTSLEKLDKERPPPPPNPTGQPQQKPIPLSELMRLFESSGKSLVDAALDLERGASGLKKVEAISGSSEKDREISAKASSMATKATELKASVDKLAEEVSGYRKNLAGGEASPEWTL